VLVAEEGQQRCLMEDACNGNKDEGSIGLCVTYINETAEQFYSQVEFQTTWPLF